MVGCRGAGPGGLPPRGGPETKWSAWNRPRPDPLPGAVRISVGEIAMDGDPWRLGSPGAAALALQELVSAGLLRRRDVHFVERRRFMAAVERERQGLPAPPGAPPVGTSPGAEMVLQGTWTRLAPAGEFFEGRLVETASGRLLRGFRIPIPPGTDPVALGRTVVGRILEFLDETDRRPPWEDPVASAALRELRPSGVPLRAVARFLEGTLAEDRYDWEGAFQGYYGALQEGGPEFFEAETALTRAARLRAGGSLGVGDES